jgi:hypothetical protein
MQGNARTCKEMLENVRKCKEMLENAKKCEKMQENMCVQFAMCNFVQFYREHQMELKETNFAVT